MDFNTLTSRKTRWGWLPQLMLQFHRNIGCAKLRLPTQNLSIALLLISLVTLTPATLALGSQVELFVDNQQPSAGFYQLSWQMKNAQPLALQESSNAEFSTPHTIYTGSDLARVQSGKPNGHYYYRLVLPETQQVLSNTIKVEVKHHSLTRALQFFTLGGVVFIFILIAIIRGER